MSKFLNGKDILNYLRIKGHKVVSTFGTKIYFNIGKHQVKVDSNYGDVTVLNLQGFEVNYFEEVDNEMLKNLILDL